MRVQQHLPIIFKRFIRRIITHWHSLVFSIVGLMLTPGCTSDKQYADTILLNGKIITVDEKFSIAEAVAIRGGKFLAIGDVKKILALKRDSTKIIDLKGHAVIPGLIEGHAHPIEASISEYFENIPEVNTIKDLLKWIHHEAIVKEDNEWIIHPKFFITRLQDMRQLTKQELDSVAPENPVFLNGSFGGMINTKGLELSGLTQSDHPGILRNGRTGETLGLIRQSVFKLLPIQGRKITEREKSEALKKLFHLYNEVGITSVCSGGGSLEDLKVFEELSHRGELTVRVFQNIRIPFNPKMTLNQMTESLKTFGYKTGDGNEWVKVGALKVVLDGGILTGTAYLQEGWGDKAKEIFGINDPRYRGELFLSKNELIRIICAADEAEWKFTAHVTGGGGVDTLLAAFEVVNQSRPIREKRFSIIHGNFYTPEAIKKMADMRIYADMQPAWFYKDTNFLNKVLGLERMKTFHPYHSMLEAGIMINGGSDHMVKLDPNASINPYNPFPAMWAVISRKAENGAVYNPEQAITREDALKLYTINNAYASFEEDFKGSIEVGKLADLVVLSDDILTCPEEDIGEIFSLLTMVNGKIVFNKGILRVRILPSE